MMQEEFMMREQAISRVNDRNIAKIEAATDLLVNILEQNIKVGNSFTLSEHMSKLARAAEEFLIAEFQTTHGSVRSSGGPNQPYTVHIDSTILKAVIKEAMDQSGRASINIQERLDIASGIILNAFKQGVFPGLKIVTD